MLGLKKSPPVGAHSRICIWKVSNVGFSKKEKIPWCELHLQHSEGSDTLPPLRLLLLITDAPALQSLMLPSQGLLPPKW